MSSKDQLSGFLPLYVSEAVTTNQYAVHKFISELRTLWKPNGVPVRRRRLWWRHPIPRGSRHNTVTSVTNEVRRLLGGRGRGGQIGTLR